MATRRSVLKATGAGLMSAAGMSQLSLPAPALQRTGSVTIGLWQEPSSLNPHLFSTGPYSGYCAFPTLEGLCQFDVDGGLIPRLVEEVPSSDNGGISPDGLTITYRLRADILWSDGEPFTADDVVFTYEYLLNPGIPTVSSDKYRTRISSVVARDPTTVQIAFHEPFAAWPLLFNGLEIILPRHILGNDPNPAQSAFNQHPVGTGPFRIDTYSAGDQIRYVPNDHFRDPSKPVLEELVIKFITNIESIVQAIQAGEIDAAWALKENYLEELSAIDHLRMAGGPISLSDRMLFNLADPDDPDAPGSTHPVLGDVRVRQAIELAIDKQMIIDQLMAGSTPLASTIFSIPEWAAPAIPPPPFDPARATELLDEAGWLLNGDVREKNGVRAELECMTVAGDELREQMQMVMRQSLGDIGISLTINNLPANVFWGNGANSGPGNRGTFDIAIHANGPDPDPQAYLSTWACASIATEANGYAGNLNWSRYCNPEYDALLDQSAGTLDPADRQLVIQQMAEMLDRDKPIAFLFDRVAVHVMSTHIAGQIFNPWTDLTWDVENWVVNDAASRPNTTDGPV